MIHTIALVTAFFISFLGNDAHAEIATKEIVYLASLEWPPFSGKNLPDGGTSIKIVRKILEDKGYRVEVSYMPWSRALQEVRDGKAVGFLPAYAENNLSEFQLSSSFDESPLGFAELETKPVTWHNLDDLKGMRIGTVTGYNNTKEFDARAKKGLLKIEPASDDLTNLKKLTRGRLDLAAIDQKVMIYLIANTPELQKSATPLRFAPKILENKTLHVGFNKTPLGNEIKKIIDDAINQK